MTFWSRELERSPARLEVRMRRIVIALLGFGIAASAAAPGMAQAPPLDVERVLTERFGFSAADLGQLRGGQSVTKTAPIEGSEMAVFGAVRIPDDKERLVRWIRDVEGFRKAADVGISRKLGSPPAINDFGDLSLDAGELAALQKCQPGDCALRLGDRAITRFQADVDWSAADAGRRANLLTRQLLLGYADAYLRGGDAALGAAHNEQTPRLVADGFHALIQNATNLYALDKSLATYLERYPTAPSVPVEEFLYWAKGGLGPEPSITLHHLVIQRDQGSGIFIADKQLYASRYVDASLLVLWLAPPPDGQGYYLLAGLRARSSMLEGFMARMLRGRIEEESRSFLQIYLDWLRKSLSPA
jgi:hypothetical protein